MNRPQNTTMIDDLPDIGEVEESFIQPREHPNISKFIRQNHRPPFQSGVSHARGYANASYQNHEIYNPAEMRMQQEYYQNGNNNIPNGQIITEETDNLNCRDVCNHIKNCEVCKQLYKSDKSLYILIIVILAVICLLLFKKVLDV